MMMMRLSLSKLVTVSWLTYLLVAIVIVTISTCSEGVNAKSASSSASSSSHWFPSSVKPSFLSKERRDQKKFYKYHPRITTIPNAQFLIASRGGGSSSSSSSSLGGGQSHHTVVGWSSEDATSGNNIVNTILKLPSFDGTKTRNDAIPGTGSVSGEATATAIHASDYVHQTSILTGGHLDGTTNATTTAAAEAALDNEDGAAGAGVEVDDTNNKSRDDDNTLLKAQKKEMKKKEKGNKKLFKKQKRELKKKDKEIKKLHKQVTVVDKLSSTSTASTTALLLEEQKKEIKKKDKVTKKLHKQIAKKLKNRNATNKRRKFMHCAWGMLFATLNNIVPRAKFLPGMSFLTGATLLVELLRYREGFGFVNRIFYMLFGKALRKSEMDGRFTGSLYYFAGVTLTSYLYPKPCATLGIIQLAIADPTASYFGRATRHVYWSRINNGFCWGLGRNKGILGFFGGALSCVPINYRILRVATLTLAREISRRTVFLASCALGLAGAFADLIVPTPALTLPKTLWNGRIKNIPPFHVDDNFIVPLLSGVACTYIFQLAGIPIDVPLTPRLIV